ncbi:hypothetical protein B0F90DRAFT_1157037 [Multifurca ochricompacta]|uniref:Uncharacterized protein n=1 Tax=Multifurca ochricompacta TaxID=376703 RepID=A0AAD4QQG2_9AGAM|nr:hypothetical protein B0F90DRAFT_1157037 [Multifurca ochricompacta]
MKSSQLISGRGRVKPASEVVIRGRLTTQWDMVPGRQAFTPHKPYHLDWTFTAWLNGDNLQRASTGTLTGHQPSMSRAIHHCIGSSLVTNASSNGDTQLIYIHHIPLQARTTTIRPSDICQINCRYNPTFARHRIVPRLACIWWWCRWWKVEPKPPTTHAKA